VFADSSETTDENGHGTWVAGIAAARTDNLQGIAGVGYDHVQVMPIKVLDANSSNKRKQ
jgi:thermitase